MQKKILFILGLFIAISFFAFSYTFAADNNIAQDAVNSVRNVIGGAENTVENTARGISGASKDATQDMQNGANNMGNSINNAMNENNNINNANMENNNGAYTATRTSTNNQGEFMGINSTTWIWLIVAVAAVGIIAIVYYYSSQVSNKHYDEE